jgi:hypothetical protein
MPANNAISTAASKTALHERTCSFPDAPIFVRFKPMFFSTNSMVEGTPFLCEVRLYRERRFCTNKNEGAHGSSKRRAKRSGPTSPLRADAVVLRTAPLFRQPARSLGNSFGEPQRCLPCAAPARAQAARCPSTSPPASNGGWLCQLRVCCIEEQGASSMPRPGR